MFLTNQLSLTMKNNLIGTTLLPLLFLLTPNSLRAQTTHPIDLILTTPDTTNGGIVPRRLAATADGGFLATGSNGLYGYISKTSSCGKEIWTRKYLFGNETDLHSVLELPSGEIAAVGSCVNCAPGDSTQKALVVKTDPDGQLLRDTTLGRFKFNAEATDVLLTANGKLAVSGHGDVGIFVFFNRDAFLTVLDEDLKAEFWKEHFQNFQDLCAAQIQTADGGFVLAGYTIPTFLAPHRAQLFRTDAGGNLLWKYTSPHLNSEFRDIVQAADGSIIAFGDRLVDTVSKRDVYFAVLDETSGVLISEKTFSDSKADDFARSLAVLDGGFLAGAVFGEPRDTSWGRRDWVFWLDAQLNKTDEFFRDNYLFSHSMVNALPLSSDGRMFTCLSRTNFLQIFNFHFFKRRYPGQHTSLGQAPQHFQLVPRDLVTNKGIVAISGSLTAPNAYDQLRLDVLRAGVLQESLLDNSPQDFAFEPEITAELAGYDFRLFGLKNQTAELEFETCDVVAGDAYLIQGQSNAVAGLIFGATEHAYKYHSTPFVRNFGRIDDNDTLHTWRPEEGALVSYADNPSGQWGLILGKTIADNHGIPVAILNGAISGISIDSMMPDPTNPGSPDTRYGRFLQRVEKSGLRDHLRGLFMFQGETNAAGGFWDSANKYYTKFVKLDSFWKQDFPAVQQRYLFQIRPGAYFAGATLLSGLQVAEAQRRIAENMPAWQIMSTTGMNHDGTHYYYANGYERAGYDIYRLVAHDLYGVAETENMHPPVVDSLRFTHCDRREITLHLRHQGDSYNWTPGWESDFYFEGSKDNLVTAGQIAGNTVILSLSDAPGPAFTGLSYTSHPDGDQAPVKNANGIGMLMFYNLPVAPPAQLLTGQMLTTCAGDTVVIGGQAFVSPGIYQTVLSGAGGACDTLLSLTLNAYPVLQTVDTVRLCAGQIHTLPNGMVVSESGDFDLMLNSAAGCDSLVMLRVNIFEPIDLQDIQIIPDTGMASGSITVTPAGGLPGYTFLWSTGDTTTTAGSLSPGTYTVTVTDGLGCTAVFELNMTVGTTQVFSGLKVDLFPNPCGELLNLRVPELPEAADCRIWVTDILGRPVLPATPLSSQHLRLDVAALPSGAYVIRLVGRRETLWSDMFFKSR